MFWYVIILSYNQSMAVSGHLTLLVDPDLLSPLPSKSIHIATFWVMTFCSLHRWVWVDSGHKVSGRRPMERRWVWTHVIDELALSRERVHQCVSASRMVRCQNSVRSVQTLSKNAVRPVSENSSHVLQFTQKEADGRTFIISVSKVHEHVGSATEVSNSSGQSTYSYIAHQK
jgi:hypothetical protein